MTFEIAIEKIVVSLSMIFVFLFTYYDDRIENVVKRIRCGENTPSLPFGSKLILVSFSLVFVIFLTSDEGKSVIWHQITVKYSKTILLLIVALIFFLWIVILYNRICLYITNIKRESIISRINRLGLLSIYITLICYWGLGVDISM